MTPPDAQESAPADPRGGEREALNEACKPWEFHVGEPPDYDSPLAAVYGAGIAYAHEQLAKLLDVERWFCGDGHEDFELDVRETGANILRAAGLVNADGDILTGAEVSTLSSPPAETQAREPGAEARLREPVAKIVADAEHFLSWAPANFPKGSALIRSLLNALHSEARKPIPAGWSPLPVSEADHRERLSAANLKLAGWALSEWAYGHLAQGYGVSLTVREVVRLIEGAAENAISTPPPPSAAPLAESVGVEG